MPAPTASYVRLTDDTGNTGKKARTQTRTVGADSVVEHFFTLASRRSIVGVYYYTSALLSVQIAASSPQDGTSTGFWWIQNPNASGVTMLVRELALRFNNSGATVSATGPRILAQKFTFTGTASGATVTPAKRKAADATPLSFVRTAVTGMTVSLDAGLVTFFAPSIMTAVGDSALASQVWPINRDPMDEEEGIHLAPLEGLVIYQADAGTATTDPRRFVINATVEEYE